MTVPGASYDCSWDMPQTGSWDMPQTGSWDMPGTVYWDMPGTVYGYWDMHGLGPGNTPLGNTPVHPSHYPGYTSPTAPVHGMPGMHAEAVCSTLS